MIDNTPPRGDASGKYPGCDHGSYYREIHEDLSETRTCVMCDISWEHPAEPSGNGVEQALTDMLTAARNGSLRAVCIVAVGMDGCTLSAHATSDGPDRMLLIAEAVCLQHRLTDMVREVNGGRI